jgi:hypothetical protein
MEVYKDLTVDYKDGKFVAEIKNEKVLLSLQVPIAQFILPSIDAAIAKFEAGEIDLVKGTDLDKLAALQVLNALKAELSK